MQNVYSPMSHANFPPNMTRRYPPPTALHARGGRIPPYMPSPMMGGPPMRHNNGNRRSGGNSPPQSLLGGYRPPPGHFRGRGGPMNNPAYVHNMASMLNLLQQQQQKPGAHKYANPNNPNNRFYQQFQDNYKKISSGQKVSNLYQASFPVQHIPREMRFNFRLLGRNIFTASDEEEEQAAAAAAAVEKRSKQRRDSSSESDSHSDDDRRKRRDENDEDEEKPTTTKSKSSPIIKNSNEQKRSSTKNNRNRNSSSTTATTAQHSKSAAPSHELLSNSANLSSLLAGIMQSENPEMFANTLATAAAAANSKRERTKKNQEKKVQKFKKYARIQQIQATAGGVVPATNPEEVEKKIHGLARRLVS
jgi:hypothetical protein